jgi:hypothetical protein
VLSIRGVRIAGRRTGSGDPLLLLNGLVQPTCGAHPQRPPCHDLQKPGPAAIVAQLVEQFLDSETSLMG